jgi:hypothetical protein
LKFDSASHPFLSLKNAANFRNNPSSDKRFDYIKSALQLRAARKREPRAPSGSMRNQSTLLPANSEAQLRKGVQAYS